MRRGTSLPEMGEGQELLVWVQDSRKTGREEASPPSPTAGRPGGRMGPLLQAQRGLREHGKSKGVEAGQALCKGSQ